MKRIKFYALILTVLLLFTCCAPAGGTPITDGTAHRYMEDAYKIAVFHQSPPEKFWARDDRGNGSPFNCSFKRDNAKIEDGVLTLWLTTTDSGYAGAEYRNVEKTPFGYYAVSMKAARCDGVISSFFIYCGRPWDEIDIEFLGNDTTKVQFNYYHNGQGNHEYLYDLGFDASEEFHEYGFDWQPDSITWYVDGKPVYKATTDIPTAAGNLMVNLWNVADSHAYWAGKFDSSPLPVTAQYQWFGYQSADCA